MTVADRLDRVLAMTEFQAVFSELKNADQQDGAALDEYFGAKARVMIAEVDQDGKWYSGLRDTAKKSGVVVKGGLGLLRKAAEYVRERPLGDVDDRAKVALRAGAQLGEEVFARAED